MKYLVVLLIVVLCVLHHDTWWWDSPARLEPGAEMAGDHAGLVFGFMPIGLAWHTFISCAAGFTWWLAVKFCWPAMLDDESTPAAGEGASE